MFGMYGYSQPPSRDDPCPARGFGLTHTQDYTVRQDGGCIHCGAIVSAGPPSNAAGANYPDNRAYQPFLEGLPFEEQMKLMTPIELDALFDGEPMNPVAAYKTDAQQHALKRMAAERGRRPQLARKEDHAARLLRRAADSEEATTHPGEKE